jgi:GT2 family glycosyltransferase
MDLSVIIVNYRAWTSLGECLDSLASFSEKRFIYEVIIVDNNSDDGIYDSFIKKYAAPFNFIRNKNNGGFANGCNLGAANARGRYLLFLNPDTVADENAVSTLLEAARTKPERTLLSCCQVNSRGKESKAYGNFLAPGMLTGPGRAFWRMIRRERFMPAVEEGLIIPDWISGSVIMISKEFFNKLGGFDEDFWLYFEDMDLCKRARNSGGEIFYLTNIAIRHNHGGSSRINIKTTALTKTEVLISKHLYVSKHFSAISKVMAHTLLIIYNLIPGILIALAGFLLFFIRKIFVRSLIIMRLVSYYSGVLLNRSWIGSHSVNYGRRPLN